MKKKFNKKQKDAFVKDFKEFINSLMFEDPSTVLSKSYRWLRAREEEIEGFGIDVDMTTSTVNALIRFAKDDTLAFTLFEGN